MSFRKKRCLLLTPLPPLSSQSRNRKKILLVNEKKKTKIKYLKFESPYSVKDFFSSFKIFFLLNLFDLKFLSVEQISRLNFPFPLSHLFYFFFFSPFNEYFLFCFILSGDLSSQSCYRNDRTYLLHLSSFASNDDDKIAIDSY